MLAKPVVGRQIKDAKIQVKMTLDAGNGSESRTTFRQSEVGDHPGCAYR